MEDTMTIQTYILDLLFYIVVLLAGVDITLSGWLALRRGIIVLQRPKLLGLLILRIMNKIYDTSPAPNRYFELLYSFKYLRVYTFISGLLIMMSSLIMLLIIALQLFS